MKQVELAERLDVEPITFAALSTGWKRPASWSGSAIPRTAALGGWS